MELLDKFGFDFKLFIAQAVNFLVLVYIFKRFLYKPIFNALTNRGEIIKKGLYDAEKSKELLAQAGKHRDEILGQARMDAQCIIENTRKTAEAMREEILAKSKEESERIIIQAREQAQSEMRKLEKQMKAISLDLSEKIMLNSIKGIFSEKEMQSVYGRVLNELKKDGGDTVR